MLFLFGGRYTLNGRLPNGCARARAERRRQRRREGRAFNARPPAAWSSRSEPRRLFLRICCEVGEAQMQQAAEQTHRCPALCTRGRRLHTARVIPAARRLHCPALPTPAHCAANRLQLTRLGTACVRCCTPVGCLVLWLVGWLGNQLTGN